MSFRSRSRTIQPIVTRRSSSLTRTPGNSISSPLSIRQDIYSSRPYTANFSPKSSSYSSYSPASTNSPSSTRNLGLSNGGHYFDYSNLPNRRESYGSNNSVSYKSPYKDLDRYGSSNSTSSYTSPYKERYVSPYTNYENGITTAGLNISLNKGYRNSNILSSNGLSGSNTSLNNYSSTPYSPSNVVGRSQSLREHERRSRTRSRASAASNNSAMHRSLSTTSVQSEGYESGSERSRSRLGSTNSLAPEVPDHKSESKENGGDFIDYKALYEAAKADNDKLKLNLRKKDEEVYSLKAALDRFTNATTKNSLSELEKREKRAMERKVSEMEEELKQLDSLKTENQRLKDENGALIRVISKLSR